MKKALWVAAVAVMMVSAAGMQNASAQKFELGARVGISSQDMSNDFVEGRLGWHAAVVSRMRLLGIGDGLLGAGLFLQPEVVYTQSRIKTTSTAYIDSDSGPSMITETGKFRVQTVDVPLLLSLKVSIARIQAGPVFNLMTNANTVNGGLEFLPLRPAVGYVLGASVDLLGLTIDGRYHGDFAKTKFENWSNVKGSFSSWSLGVGLMF